MQRPKIIVKLVFLTGFSAGILMTTGCASIVNGANQSISLETRSATGESVAGVNCKLENPKGTWFVTTPGSVTVHRAYDDLSIYCNKAGEQPGIASVKSSTKGMAFGNLLFGGVIGVGVDAATGAAYDYPPLITVQLGSNATIAPPAANPTVAPALAQASVVTPDPVNLKMAPASVDALNSSVAGLSTGGSVSHRALPQ